MIVKLDEIDRKILKSLQQNATLSVDALSEIVHLSRNACWRRIKILENSGVIKGRIALLDAESLGLGLSVFVMISTNNHDADWIKKFRNAVKSFPQIVGAHRMSGDLDYILRVVVGSVAEYDQFYQQLIKKVPIANVSASFAMETIVDTTALPLS